MFVFAQKLQCDITITTVLNLPMGFPNFSAHARPKSQSTKKNAQTYTSRETTTASTSSAKISILTENTGGGHTTSYSSSVCDDMECQDCNAVHL